MELQDHLRFGKSVMDGKVFCVDCASRILFNKDFPAMFCTTCNKSGFVRPELDADDKPLAITDEGDQRFYGRVHPFIIN